jgi:hypothetical protein
LALNIFGETAYRINFHQLFQSMLNPGMTLGGMAYFTTPICWEDGVRMRYWLVGVIFSSAA